MDRIWDWIRTLLYFGLFLTILMQLLPHGKYKKYVRFFAGMIFLILVLGPVFELFSDGDILKSAVEKLEYQQEQETVDMDFSYMEQKQQEYYRKQTLASAEKLIAEEADKEGFWLADASIVQEEGSEAVQSVTLTVRETKEDSAKEEDPDEITAIEAVRIGLSGGEEEEKKTDSLPASGKAKKLQEEIADLFGIQKEQVEILEE